MAQVVTPTRCKAITLGNQPGHLLVRCIFDEGHDSDHLPSWSEADRNE